jgi:hypothetical protein
MPLQILHLASRQGLKNLNYNALDKLSAFASSGGYFSMNSD